jgi:hypothetical protein
MESPMTKTFLISLSLALLPNVVSGEPGSGTDLYRVNREVEAMMRDGRWEALLREGQANRQALGATGQIVRPPQSNAPVTSTGSPRARRPR